MSKILESFLSNERALKKFLTRFLKRQQDIDDIAQETFLKAYAAEIKSEITSPKAYLFGVAKNTALHALEKKANTTTDFYEDSASPSILQDRSTVNAEDLLDSRRKMAVFADAVSGLPPRCREVFLMRKVEGLKNKEIAGELGISVSAVEKHIVSALMHCSQYFRQQGYDPAELGPIAIRYCEKTEIRISKVKRSQDDGL